MTEEYKVKLALVYASFLHDIGKIAQRTGDPSKYKDNQIEKSLIQPGFGYFHVLYTREFFDREVNSHSLDTIFQAFGNPLLDGNVQDTVTNLACKHHLPETSFQWIIAKSDRLSAGHDRKPQDEQDELTGKAYLKTRCKSIFSLVDIGQSNFEKDYFYELKTYNGNSLKCKFPVKKEDLDPAYDLELKENYKKLYDEFVTKFETEIIPLLQSNQEIFSEQTLWKFLTLCERYYSPVPSSTLDLPDINLYEHSYLIASIAVALYDYHRVNHSLDIIDSIKDDSLEKFILIQGDLSGIQSYILNYKQESTKGLAKILRARSFYLQMISKSIERKVLEVLELPPTSVLMSAGSKFQILAPNVSYVQDRISQLQKEIDKWILHRYMGDISFQLDSSVSFSPKDLLSDPQTKQSLFTQVLLQASEALEQKKRKKFHSILVKDGKWNVKNFFFTSQYETYLTNGVCSVQGYYPAATSDEDSQPISQVAYEEREIGKAIPNHNYLHFGTSGKASLPFEKFSIEDKGFFRLLQNANTLEPSFSFIGHLPKFQSDDQDYKNFYKKAYCTSCNENVPQGCEIFSSFTNKSFHCLAQESLREVKGEWIGSSFLGVLKADVDNLGTIFQTGLSGHFSISRYVNLSKSLNYFFTEYLSELLEKKYTNIYTVYAGGDDLFLLGPFPTLLDFTKEFYEQFRNYTCHNPNLSFSAGFALQKPRAPISLGAHRAEAELENAKHTALKDEQGNVVRAEKNSISIFGTKLSWKDFSKSLEIKNKLIGYIDEGLISSAMMYRLLKYVRMYKSIKENPANAIYNSYFAYDKSRNIYDKISKDRNQPKDAQYQELAQFLENWFADSYENRRYLDFLEVPLQLAIYQSRGGK